MLLLPPYGGLKDLAELLARPLLIPNLQTLIQASYELQKPHRGGDSAPLFRAANNPFVEARHKRRPPASRTRPDRRLPRPLAKSLPQIQVMVADDPEPLGPAAVVAHYSQVEKLSLEWPLLHKELYRFLLSPSLIRSLLSCWGGDPPVETSAG